jgi:hypothetical protein
MPVGSTVTSLRESEYAPEQWDSGCAFHILCSHALGEAAVRRERGRLRSR